MTTWTHLHGGGHSTTLHLASHDREPCGDGRPVYTARQTRHGFALCGEPISDDFEDIYDPDEHPDAYVCGSCRRVWREASRP